MALTLTNPRVSDGAVWSFDTVADMKACPSIRIGDVAYTKCYRYPGDGGEGTYNIVAAATGTDDGGSYHDLTGITGQAELAVSTVVKAEQFGVTLDTDGSIAERSSEWQTAMYFAASLAADERQEDDKPQIHFYCSTPFKTKNTLHISKANGSRTALLVIHNEVKIIVDTDAWDAGDGTLSAHTDDAPIPLLNWRLQVSQSYWGELDCKHRCAGVRVRANVRHFAYHGDLHSFRRYGVLVLNNSNGNFRLIDWNIKQWLLSDTADYPLTPGGSVVTGGADNPDVYDGDCYVSCYKDHIATGGTWGWSGTAILLIDETGRWGNTVGKDIYYDGLVSSGDGFYHSANRVTSLGCGDDIFQNVHVMQGFGGNATQPRITNIENGGPASIVSYNTTNEAFFIGCDIDASTVQLYGPNVHFVDCSYISGGTNQQDDRVVVWDPRVRVYKHSRGSNFGGMLFKGIRGVTVGFFESDEGPPDGDYAAFNALNQPGGDDYTGTLTFVDFYDASAGVMPSGTADAGDMWIVSGAGTVGAQSFIEGDYMIAKVNNPGTSWNTSKWVQASYGDVTARQGNRRPEVAQPVVEVYPVDTSTIPYQEFHRPGGAFNARWNIAGTELQRNISETEVEWVGDVTYRFEGPSGGASILYIGSSDNGFSVETGHLTVMAGGVDAWDFRSTGNLRPINNGTQNLGGVANKIDAVYLTSLPGLPTYADNTAALAGGLLADDVYKTSAGEIRIVV